jgi:ATP:ADP antiporter, AAA family
MVKAHRLLSIERGDVPRLTVLAPSFAVTAACTVILASLSKALFLSTNPIRLLPWMFLGAAAITAASSLGYVALMGTMRLEARLRLLLVIAIASLLGLRLGFPLTPAVFGVVILLWCPTIGHLLVLQVWNVATSLLPTRQGKRLMPVLAAVTTLGAALGGVLVQFSLRWLEAEDLLVVAGGALLYPLLRVRHIIEGLGGDQSVSTSSSASRDDRGRDESEIVAGFRSIARTPLLRDLALLMFLLQAASLIVDYQFSAELKPRFDKDGIASFLGTYFWTSNLVVLALTLLTTSRFIRAVGIGVALAASGIVIGLGSGLYFFAATNGTLPLFWVVAATAFAERVASYAYAKPAVQMAYMPLQMSGGERAKTIIDGVIYRLGTATVSVLLLVAAPELATQFRLSLPATVGCLVVLYLGLRISPHYRHALFEALRERRLDAQLVDYLRNGLGRGATQQIDEELRSASVGRILLALEVARELALAPSPALLDKLAEHEDERVARAALEVMEALGRQPGAELLGRMLGEARPPKLLRALLRLLTDRASPELAEIVRPLTEHPDPSVASAACLFRIRAAGALASFDAEIQGRTAMVRLTGMTLAGDFARALPDLVRHPVAKVRHDAIEQMGELRLALFVAPLIACLDIADARQLSAEALVGFGDRALGSIDKHLAKDRLSLSVRVTLLGILERIASPGADEALLRASGSEPAIIRDHAIEALWRRSTSPAAPQLDSDALTTLAAAETTRLTALASIEAALAGRAVANLRLGLFAADVTALREAAERRIFRLVGLLYDRAALQRAYLHYRSPQARVRSNAIELLEQHITEPRLRRFVTLVERDEDEAGRMRPMSRIAASDHPDIEALVEHDPWLVRLWQWVGRSEATTGMNWDDPLDRLAQMKRTALFDDVPGEPLLELVEALERRVVVAGAAAFRRGDEGGDMFWVLDGELALSADDGPAISITQHECFGEVSAIDGRPRCCDAIATTDAVVARARRSDFDDAATLFPAILRRLVAVLSRRLRARIA